MFIVNCFTKTLHIHSSHVLTCTFTLNGQPNLLKSVLINKNSNAASPWMILLQQICSKVKQLYGDFLCYYIVLRYLEGAYKGHHISHLPPYSNVSTGHIIKCSTQSFQRNGRFRMNALHQLCKQSAPSPVVKHPRQWFHMTSLYTANSSTNKDHLSVSLREAEGLCVPGTTCTTSTTYWWKQFHQACYRNPGRLLWAAKRLTV